MNAREARLVVTELAASWHVRLPDEEVMVWAHTMSKFDFDTARSALESCRDAYDRLPSHHQFTDAVRSIERRSAEQDKARAAIDAAPKSDHERAEARENLTKIRKMLRPVGNFGK